MIKRILVVGGVMGLVLQLQLSLQGVRHVRRSI